MKSGFRGGCVGSPREFCFRTDGDGGGFRGRKRGTACPQPFGYFVGDFWQEGAGWGGPVKASTLDAPCRTPWAGLGLSQHRPPGRQLCPSPQAGEKGGYRKSLEHSSGGVNRSPWQTSDLCFQEG